MMKTGEIGKSVFEESVPVVYHKKNVGVLHPFGNPPFLFVAYWQQVELSPFVLEPSHIDFRHNIATGARVDNPRDRRCRCLVCASSCNMRGRQLSSNRFAQQGTS